MSPTTSFLREVICSDATLKNYFLPFLDCNNWTEWRGSRYRYIDSKQNWEQSTLKCQEEHNDGHLVFMETKEENEFVLNLISSCTAEEYFWIGLNDRSVEGE